MYNIIDFGAVGDAGTNVTGAIQAAVDACHQNNGGVVYVPHGVYVVASIHLYDNIHFVFEPGAKFLGSLDPDDFDEREEVSYPLYQDFSHSFFHRSMFWAENCNHISFAGRGVIDMQSVWEKEPVPGENAWCGRRANKIFSFKNCSNVVISELNLYNATDLGVYLAGCENVRITGLNMNVHIDGISPDCCKNVVISDCNIVAGDDGIVLKSSYTLNENRVCENVVVSNCTVSSRMCAIKLGTESNGGFRNIAINNCAIYDTCLAGVALEIADGGDLDGVVVTGMVMKNVGTPLLVMLTDRRRGPEHAKLGTMKNIIIDNLIATGPYEPIAPIRYTTILPDEKLLQEAVIVTSGVVGHPDCKVENVTLSNIRITVPGGGTEDDRKVIVQEVSNQTPAPAALGKVFPAYGIYFRHVKNLKMKNVSIDTMEPDVREPFVFDDVIEVGEL